MADRRTVLVAGAGIGGLTAALALAEAGFRVVVAERNDELSALGAGIQLSPNAARILAALGLDAAIAAAATEPAAIDVRNGLNDRLLASLPGPRFRQRYGDPYRAIHRADLQAILASAVLARDDISLRLGATVGAVVRQGKAHLARIERIAGGNDVMPVAAIIGADGVWSTMRDRVSGSANPMPTGRTAWRALVPVADFPAMLAPDRVGLWLGGDAHLVSYPVSGGAMMNIVAIVEEAWNEAGWNAPGDVAWIGERFIRWGHSARAVVAAASAWQKWSIMALDPSAAWVDGPVALLGDAAHAMPPFIAQGGAMAIEDAAVLARCLAADTNASSALRTYEAARKPRAAAVARAAARTGAVYHWRRPWSLARDAALRLLGPRLILGRNDWIYR